MVVETETVAVEVDTGVLVDGREVLVEENVVLLVVVDVVVVLSLITVNNT